jgi:hypothetical protein
MILGQLSVILDVLCDPRRGGCGLTTPAQLPFGTYSLPFSCPGCRNFTLIPIHLSQSKVVHLPQSKVHAFGDESRHDNVVAYGLFVIEGHNLQAAEQLLSGLKRRYGIDPQVEFHFAELIHQSKRKKTPWKDLTIRQIMEFADELILGLVELSPQYLIGGVHRSDYPEDLPAVDHWPSGEMKEKQLAGLLCGGVLAKLNEGYRQDQVKFWADPDSTRVPFFGKTMRADSHYKLTNNDANQHIMPEPFDEEDKPALLQVADLFVYTATHALTERVRTQREV